MNAAVEPAAQPPGVTDLALPAWATWRACDLPRLMADNGTGLGVLRQYAKNWAVASQEQRIAVSTAPPRRARWRHRFTQRRDDLARVAALVHALCLRDGVPVPDWVTSHTAKRTIALDGKPMHTARWARHVREHAVDVCRIHDVWFLPVDLDDYRVHGFR